eukprot:GHUV01018437.1.p1 GENE.GHUV01018437.1~~GHUV01018437.1.p1  ORF type:complete len:345 (+),score=78.36 GHUV01018437.1:609-1643(+)
MPSRTATNLHDALLATGGVLKPPGGPSIPLFVNYATEVQPYLGRLLGRGGFGHVYEGLWRGQRVAVKLLTVDAQVPDVLDAFLKEVALCACLQGCDRVVKLLGACLGGVASAATAANRDGGTSPHTAAGAPTKGSQLAATATARGSKCHDGSKSYSSSPNSSSPFAVGLSSPFCCQHVLPSTIAATHVSDQRQKHQQQSQQQQMALIMELMEGGSLAQRIYHPGRRRLTYVEILQIALDITAGLAYLHPVVVHRDLKPHNVLLDKDGRAAIADFGISRFKDPCRSHLSITHQGGTPNYMAPELFNGRRVSEAADVYSLGCILYECLARKQPFVHLVSQANDFNV